MGFLSGAVTFLRFRVSGPAPRLFDADHLDKLADRAAGRQRIAAADGVEVGWTAGGHVLDTDFTLDKNVVNDSLHFELCVESDKLPADKLKAYTAVELAALAKNNPSGFASARQKREAKEVARERLEEEAKDGRYRKRKCVPVMWDRTTGEVLFGATSLTQVDRLCSLFEQTFGVGLGAITADALAARFANDPATEHDECENCGPEFDRQEIEQEETTVATGEKRTVVYTFCRECHALDPEMGSTVNSVNPIDDAKPSAFIPGTSTADVAWIPHEDNFDWLGNEFMLWLWYCLDANSDTLTLPDGSEATVMIARSLTLECPRGQTGADAFAHEGPARLPEARRAIQSGKLPRKCGLTVVRHDQQYEFTLHAETLAVGAAKMPAPPEDATDSRAKLDARVDAVRSLVETLDGLYSCFLSRRLGREWADDLGGMQGWLARKERVAGAA
jgi:hypothetical protein